MKRFAMAASLVMLASTCANAQTTEQLVKGATGFDHDERLRITGVEPGRYDAKVSYPNSRQCIVRDIEIRADAVFSIADKDLKDCTK